MSAIAGMNPRNGRRADQLAHLRDSVENILTTPVGSLVMRRDYGSLVPELIDQPLVPATLLRVYSATVLAIARWEPRLRVRGVRQGISSTTPGRATLDIDALTVAGDRPAELSVNIR